MVLTSVSLLPAISSERCLSVIFPTWYCSAVGPSACRPWCARCSGPCRCWSPASTTTSACSWAARRPGGLQAHGHLPGHHITSWSSARSWCCPAWHSSCTWSAGQRRQRSAKAQPRHPGRGLGVPRVLHLPGHRLVPLLGLPDRRCLPSTSLTCACASTAVPSPWSTSWPAGTESQRLWGASQGGLPAGLQDGGRAGGGGRRHAQHGHPGDAVSLGNAS